MIEAQTSTYRCNLCGETFDTHEQLVDHLHEVGQFD